MGTAAGKNGRKNPGSDFRVIEVGVVWPERERNGRRRRTTTGRDSATVSPPTQEGGKGSFWSGGGLEKSCRVRIGCMLGSGGEEEAIEELGKEVGVVRVGW